MKPLVSIIVPVYKVENYLDDTVTCMLNQTYENIELILVDDGSPDRCGEMCDAYAEQDARVHVIHKTNGGLSSARNAGVEICAGDYIAFIDSDDVASTDYIEYLFSLCLEKNADMAVCLTRDFPDGTKPTYDMGLNYEHILLTGKESLAKLFYMDEIRTGVIGKLFSRRLLPCLNFPEGIYYEDAWPMYQAHLHAEHVALGRAYKFGYRHRSSSQSKQNFSLKEMACVSEWNRIAQHVRENAPELSVPLACRAYSAYSHIFFMIPSGKFQEEKQYCWNMMKSERKTVITDRNARKKARFAALLSLSGKSITHHLGKKLIYTGL